MENSNIIFPDEIILRIMKLTMSVDSGSLRFNTSLFRASKKFNQMAQIIIWKDIVVDDAAWPWTLSRLSRYTEAMTQLQHLSIQDTSVQQPRIGELSGEGLYDLLHHLPPSLQSLELDILGIDVGQYSQRISFALRRVMRNLRSLRLVAARGTTADALATIAGDSWEGVFPTLEQLSIIVSQYPQQANTPVAIQRFNIIGNIAKHIATARSKGQFPKLKRGRISTYDYHQQEYGMWSTNEHGKNTVDVFDLVRRIVVNSPLVTVAPGLIWTQHVIYREAAGPSRAVRHEGWEDDLPEGHRPGARLIEVIGDLQELMDVWDGHQWVTSDQGVRVPRLVLDGSLGSRGLSVREIDSDRWFATNRSRVTERDADAFMRRRYETLDLRFVPDVYLLEGDDDDL